ncbi:MAG: sigma-70 family RNA polymerase sigma factor [Planctomycetota bacterium]
MTVTSPEHANDARLVAAALQGDAAAWTELVDLHLRPTFAVAAAVTGSHVDAEDLVQDAFLHAFNELASLREPERFGAWLAGIVRRQAIHRHRVGSRRREILNDYAAWKDAARDREPEPGEFAEVWTAIGHLPEALRVPLLLYYFEGESATSVATRLDLPAPTVRKRLQLARDRMRGRLEDSWRQRTGALRPSPALRNAVMLALATTLATVRDAEASGPESIGAESAAAPADLGTARPAALSSKAASAFFMVLGLVGVVLLWSILAADPSANDDGTSDAVARPSVAVNTAVETPVGEVAAADGPSGGDRPAPATNVEGREEVAPPRAIVTGRLLWEDGLPLAGRQVALGMSERFWSLTPQQTVVTDEQGLFRFELESETDCWLYLDDGAACNCLTDAWLRPSFQVPTAVEVRVQRGSELTTQVVAAATGQPIADARVVFSTAIPNQQGEAFARTGEAGECHLSLLPDGAYQVVVSHPEFTSSVSYCELPLSGPLEIQLQPPRLLHLQVVGLPADHDGAVRMSLRALERSSGTSSPRFSNREELFLAGVVDQFGWVTLVAPPVGTWEATFYRTLDRRRIDLEIPPGSDAVVRRVHLAEGARIEGWVHTGWTEDDAAAPSPVLREVFLAGLSGDLEQEQKAPLSDTGAFRLEGVRAGSYLLGVRRVIGGWPLQPKTQPRWVSFLHHRVHVNADEVVQLNLQTPRSAGVELLLPRRTLRSTSLLTLRVAALDVAADLFRFRFDDAGRVRDVAGASALAIVQTDEVPDFRELPAGRYLVEAALDGVTLAPVEIELSPTTVAVVQLQDGLAPGTQPLLLHELAQLRDPDPMATRQVFVPAFSDFHGWHFVRSRIVREVQMPTTTVRDGPVHDGQQAVFDVDTER